MRTLEMVDFEKVRQVCAGRRTIVNDPNTAEALKPYYRQFCSKRPRFHRHLDTFNRPNVTLVHTDGKRIESALPNAASLRTRSSTSSTASSSPSGFKVGTPLEPRAGYEVYGRRGVALSQRQKYGVSTMFGTFKDHFPMLHRRAVADRRVGQHSTRTRRAEPLHRLHPEARARSSGAHFRTAEAEAAWVQKVIDASVSVKFLESCTPGYYNNEGQPKVCDPAQRF